MITNYNQIDLAGSPIIVPFSSTLNAGDIPLYYEIILNMWQGNFSKATTYKASTVILYVDCSLEGSSDTTVDIASHIRAFLNKPYNDKSINTFDFNALQSNISYMSCYYSVKYKLVFNNGATIRASKPITTKPTRAALMGYNWSTDKVFTYEDKNGADGFDSKVVNKYWSYGIKYFKYSVVLNTSTTSTLIAVSLDNNIPLSYQQCTPEPILIVFRNKQGLWDTFTPFGKVVQSNKINKDSWNSINKNGRRSNITNTKFSRLNNVEQTFTINTGMLSPEMIDVVEELVYSDCIFIIQYNGKYDIITADSALITADNDIITVDGFYTANQQFPVEVDETNFTRKNNINDKGRLNYNIKFKATNSKIVK